MTSRLVVWSAVIVALTTAILAASATRSWAGPAMNLDIPGAGTHKQKVWLAGWAIDTDATSGTGVSAIHVWAYPNPGSGQSPIFLGTATYGVSRPDVDAAYGGTGRYINSGWSFLIQGLAPGLYEVHAYAFSTATATFNQERVVNLTLQADPRMAVDVPNAQQAQQPFMIGGWAIDAAAATGTGVNTVHVWAQNLSGGAAIPLGAATYGVTRPDVGAAFGTQFTQSGYELTVSGLAVGTYRFTLYAYSLVANSFNQAMQFDVVVDPVVATPLLSVGSGTYYQDFSVTASTSTGATLRYTTNGSDPTSASAVFPSSLFVNGTTTLKVRGFRDGWTTSATATATYVLEVGPPAASVPGGTYAAGQTVSLTPAGVFDTVRYTTDGSAVTEGSPQFFAVNPIVLDGPIVLRARSYRGTYSPSPELQVSYMTRVATPTMSPGGGPYQTLPLVGLTTVTVGATIRYTLDRTDPTESSPAYVGHIVTHNFMSIRARAYKAGWAPSEVAEATYWDFTPEPTSAVAVTVTGPSPVTPVGVGGTVSFQVSGGSMTTDPLSVFAYRNGVRLTGSAIQISTSGVTLPNVLVDGENRLELEALDQEGLVFWQAQTLWAGSRTLTVTVRRRLGGAPVAGATVVAQLQQAPVSASGATNGSGVAALSNLPSNHPARLVVSATGFRSAEVEVSPTATNVVVDLDEATFNFSSLAGWQVQTPRAWTQPHTEASTALVACPDCLGHGGTFDPLEGSVIAADGATDFDLVIDTKNLYGPQTVTRTVAVAPGTSQVTARFRFQTDEMWWALPGRSYFPHYDDWFTVRIEPVGRPAEAVTYARTVTQLLNTGQFNNHAATPWYTLSLPTQFSDTVVVTFTVANAVTNGHLSILFADIVQETTHRVEAVALRDLIDPADPYVSHRPPEERPLRRLSMSPMPTGQQSYEGYIPVHGTVRITGPATETLTDVWLEVWDNGVKIATAPLARTSASNVRSQLLGVPFGTDGVLEVSELSVGIAPVLFELDAATLTGVNQTEDTANLVVQVHAKRSNGSAVMHVTVRDPLVKLVLFGGAARYGDRDVENCFGLDPGAASLRNRPPFRCGGDSWALPTVVSWAAGVSGVTWGDFSNMHGGFFPIHSGHRAGVNIDGYFAGYPAMNAAAAQAMLALVNAHAARIEKVWVSYSTTQRASGGCGGPTVAPAANNDYWHVIKDAVLADGRLARAVILNERGHCGHFDVTVRKAPQ